MRACAVVAHHENAVRRYLKCVLFALCDTADRQIVLVQLLSVDIDEAALKGHRLSGQSHHPLHQHVAHLLVPERDDAAPLRRRIADQIGQPPAYQQRFGGNGGLHGAAGHVGQLQQHAEDEHYHRQRHQQIAVVAPQPLPPALLHRCRAALRHVRRRHLPLRRIVPRSVRPVPGQTLAAFVFHMVSFRRRMAIRIV